MNGLNRRATASAGFAVVAVMALVSGAQAAEVVGQFTGTAVEINVGAPAGFNYGTVMSGSFSYDPTMAASIFRPTSDVAVYTFITGASFDVDSGGFLVGVQATAANPLIFLVGTEGFGIRGGAFDATNTIPFVPDLNFTDFTKLDAFPSNPVLPTSAFPLAQFGSDTYINWRRLAAISRALPPSPSSSAACPSDRRRCRSPGPFSCSWVDLACSWRCALANRESFGPSRSRYPSGRDRLKSDRLGRLDGRSTDPPARHRTGPG
ncbi:MAG: hypothetical protein WDO24_29800 [Pseudomonadota bacterium]